MTLRIAGLFESRCEVVRQAWKKASSSTHWTRGRTRQKRMQNIDQEEPCSSKSVTRPQQRMMNGHVRIEPLSLNRRRDQPSYLPSNSSDNNVDSVPGSPRKSSSVSGSPRKSNSRTAQSSRTRIAAKHVNRRSPEPLDNAGTSKRTGRVRTALQKLQDNILQEEEEEKRSRGRRKSLKMETFSSSGSETYSESEEEVTDSDADPAVVKNRTSSPRRQLSEKPQQHRSQRVRRKRKFPDYSEGESEPDEKPARDSPKREALKRQFLKKDIVRSPRSQLIRNIDLKAMQDSSDDSDFDEDEKPCISAGKRPARPAPIKTVIKKPNIRSPKKVPPSTRQNRSSDLPRSKRRKGAVNYCEDYDDEVVEDVPTYDSDNYEDGFYSKKSCDEQEDEASENEAGGYSTPENEASTDDEVDNEPRLVAMGVSSRGRVRKAAYRLQDYVEK